MKTQLLSTFLLLTLSLSSNAQEIVGSFYELAQTGQTKIELDYSEAVIHGMNEDDFAIYETDWYKDKPMIMGLFMREFSDALRSSLLFRKNSNNLTIVVKFTLINTKGDTTLNIHLVKNKGSQDEVILGSILDIKEEGGSIGSKLNLIKDGAEHSGEKAGKTLRKVILASFKQNNNAQ